MKLLRYIIIAGLVICSVAAVSCKKDKKGSTSTKAYLSGSFSLDIPSYVNRGDVFHIDPYGVYMGETADSLVGYRWTDPFTSKSDTLRYEDEPASVGKAFDFVIPDDADLKTFTLSVAAFAEGYYDKNATATFTVVDSTPETGSLSGYSFLGSASSFTDTRDDKEYYYVTIAGKDWMIQNLAWDGAGKSYANSSAVDPIFGRYYDWDEALSACPAGWSLPGDADFEAVAALAGGSSLAAGSMMVDASFNGNKMWEFWPAVNITNSSRFSAIPVGYYQVDGSKSEHKNFSKYALFWTSDTDADGLGIARYIYHDQPALFKSSFGKGSVMASVRCVR